MPPTHTASGKFAPGNNLGKGNPFAKKVAALRAAMLDATSESDIYAIVTKLIDQAKEGDVASAKEVLDRTIGKAQGNDNVSLTVDGEAKNPFIDYLRDRPDLARATSVLIRGMARDARNDGVASDAWKVDVAGSSGPPVEQADGGSGDTREEPDGDDAAPARKE